MHCAMAAFKRPPPPPSQQQLQAALQRLQNRPGCPLTLEAALQHPVYGICVRGLARTLQPTPAGIAGTPSTAAPAAKQRKPWAWPAGAFDARAAAANDLQDPRPLQHLDPTH